jgi:hypothetical protein
MSEVAYDDGIILALHINTSNTYRYLHGCEKCLFSLSYLPVCTCHCGSHWTDSHETWSPKWVKIIQIYQTHSLKTKGHFIFVCDIKFTIKAFFATVIIFMLLTMTAQQYTQCIVVFLLQQWLCECYAYIAYLVLSSLLGQKGWFSEQGFSIFPEPACFRFI